MRDNLIYKGESWRPLMTYPEIWDEDWGDIKNNLLENPQTWGYLCKSASTGCYRGYHMVFEFTSTNLIVKSFNFSPKLPPNTQPKPINNVYPQKGDFHMFTHKYENLNYPSKFTGSILLGREMHPEFAKKRMIFPALYQQLVEFIIVGGKITNMCDHSRRALEIWKEIENEVVSEKPLTINFLEPYFNQKITVNDK
jgi:hypothetical protein